ncbi:MAG: hypothetical protein AAGG56_15560 [Pseudomonadota bacterium]
MKPKLNGSNMPDAQTGAKRYATSATTAAPPTENHPNASAPSRLRDGRRAQSRREARGMDPPYRATGKGATKLSSDELRRIAGGGHDATGPDAGNTH